MMEITAEFFKMSFDPGVPDSPTCRGYIPRAIDRYLTKMGRPVSDWPPDMTFFCDPDYSDDYLSNPLDWFLFSQRLQATLKETAAQDIQFLPARVIEIGTGKELLDYAVMNIIRVCDAFDPDRSVWLPYHHNRSEPSDTKKLAVRKDRIGDANIFRLATQPYNFPIVSHRVKDRLEAIGATGLRFVPVLS